MLDFRIKFDDKTEEYYLETSIHGKLLLTVPQLNKGTAFTLRERLEFGLQGKLPTHIDTLAEQVERAYEQCTNYNSRLQQNIYLNNLHDKNQIVFYKLVSEHLAELLPIIYTPTVGDAVISFSRKYRQARGIYMSYPDREYLDQVLDNRSNPEIDIVVLTDGEAVLGIGDQGIGGMDIPIAKLMVYTLCGGINPNRAMPMVIDVGTDNQELLNDPDYLGWKHPRLRGKAYDDFMAHVVNTIRQKLPDAFIHWEDFGTKNARDLLERYREQFCTFNDDIQGTGATTLAAILAACKALKQKLTDQRIVIFGAGAAGCGIADQIAEGLVAEGLSAEDARKHIWLVDRPGLLVDDLADLRSCQLPYVRSGQEVADWHAEDLQNINFLDVVYNVKPTILIGCSAQGGAFTREVVQQMALGTKHPIILPLSNPTNRSEAEPENIMQWTQGKALIATGSPFAPVHYQGSVYEVAQCNNYRIFPGIGLGVIACKPSQLSRGMLLAACHALAESAPVLKNLAAPLLPGVENAESIAKRIAYAVGIQAINEGLCSITPSEELQQKILDNYWVPAYLPYRRKG
jgi:malate dehydrogenase (oxaloacetate-decarboxylating)